MTDVVLPWATQKTCQSIVMLLVFIGLWDFGQERAKAQEERKRNITEYRKFLESCDFIKVLFLSRFQLISSGFLCWNYTDRSPPQASTQWRKVQDRLEADERCSRLEKMDRLEIFQVIFLHLTFGQL